MTGKPHNHDAAELFDLRFLHAGPNSAVCCQCGRVVELGDPLQVGPLFAMIHRIVCDAAANL